MKRFLIPVLVLIGFIALPFAMPMTKPAPAYAQNNAPASFADLAEKLSPAVVNISSTQKIEDAQDFPELPQFPQGSPFEDFFEDFMERRGRGAPSEPASSLGSGFIIDAENGYIITNNHVIKDADEVRVTLHDDETLEAEVIGHDEKTDIAVLKVKTDKTLVAVNFGDSDVMRVGDWIVAIGNPFGLGGTVTAGIVSARQRDINAGPYDDFIQTDASINRGNSGGPMFNLNGEVIGINTAIFSPSGGSVGIGFAIPSALAEPVIKQIIEFGRTRRGWLGVRIQQVTDEIAESLGLRGTSGALVASVTEDSPADKAKLKAGDVILKFHGQDVETMKQLPRIVAETPIDEKVELVYWRNGRTHKTKVMVGELEKAEENGLLESSEPDSSAPAGQKIDDIGMRLDELTDNLRSEYEISNDIEGVIITEVDPESEAADKGLADGDIIVEINQQEVRDAKKVESIVKKAKKNGRASVLLLINRDGDVRFVALRLG